MRNSFKNAKAVRHAGRTYFRVDEKEFKFVYMPSKTIMVMTSMPEDNLKAMIAAEDKQADTVPPALELARQVRNSQFWGVIGLDGGVKMGLEQMAQMGGPAPPPALKSLLKAARQARVAGLWGALEGDSVSFTVGVKCDDEKSAKEVTQSVKSLLKSPMQPTAGPLGMLGALMMTNSTQKLQRELTSSLQFSNEGPLAQVSGKLSLQTLGMFGAQMAPGPNRPFPGQAVPDQGKARAKARRESR